jgi:hypothetical protein
MEIVAAIITGVLAGLGSTWVALYQVRSKQLWDRKDAVYREVLDAMHALLREHRAREMAHFAGREYPREEEAGISEAASHAHSTIGKYAETGSFVMTDQAEQILKEFKKELGEAWEQGLYEIDGDSIIRAAIKKFMKAGKEDLDSLLAANWWGKPKLEKN